jgi:hypothetical protein
MTAIDNETQAEARLIEVESRVRALFLLHRYGNARYVADNSEDKNERESAARLCAELDAITAKVLEESFS